MVGSVSLVSSWGLFIYITGVFEATPPTVAGFRGTELQAAVLMKDWRDREGSGSSGRPSSPLQIVILLLLCSVHVSIPESLTPSPGQGSGTGSSVITGTGNSPIFF